MALINFLSIHDFPLTEHVEIKLYSPIAPLGENPLPLQDIQAGRMGVSVGLLPGRCSKIMEKYFPVRDMRHMCLVLASLV